VRIGARRDGALLELLVRDDGAEEGAAPVSSRESGAGIALGNLRARLARLYGSDATLVLRPRAEGGMDAIVRIPAPTPTA
jgi:LytS/YehU family sensor histidine kinase